MQQAQHQKTLLTEEGPFLQQPWTKGTLTGCRTARDFTQVCTYLL